MSKETFKEWYMNTREEVDEFEAVAEESWNHQQKKIDELKAEVEKMELILENNLLCRKNDYKKIQDLETKLHKADSIWQAQEKKIDSLESQLNGMRKAESVANEGSNQNYEKYKQVDEKLEKAVKALKVAQTELKLVYSEDHKDFYPEIIDITLEEIEEGGRG